MKSLNDLVNVFSDGKSKVNAFGLLLKLVGAVIESMLGGIILLSEGLSETVLLN